MVSFEPALFSDTPTWFKVQKDGREIESNIFFEEEGTCQVSLSKNGMYVLHASFPYRDIESALEALKPLIEYTIDGLGI